MTLTTQTPHFLSILQTCERHVEPGLSPSFIFETLVAFSPLLQK